MAKESGGLPVVGNPFAPDILTDDALAFEFIDGSIRITLGAAKMVEPVPPSPMQMVVIGRLIMSVPAAQRLALGLFDYLKRQGHDPQQLVASETGGAAH